MNVSSSDVGMSVTINRFPAVAMSCILRTTVDGDSCCSIAVSMHFCRPMRA
jgi:hypothetical protein